VNKGMLVRRFREALVEAVSDAGVDPNKAAG
jgi:hypothetical protein